MRAIAILCMAALMVGGCSRSSTTVLFDGKSFRTKLAKGEQRNVFTVTAKPVSASLAGARMAAEYEAIVYCVNDYGSSDIRWVVGPDYPAPPIANDTLTLHGACPE
ncbi:hypothetical protein AB1M95_11670 [Sulfitobacter sp. LCG007]